MIQNGDIRIALLLHCDRNLSTFPSVCNTARLLSQAGYQVDLLVPEMMNVDCDLGPVRVIRFHPHRSSAIGMARTLVSRISLYDLLMPFQRREFMLAATLGRLRRIPCVYFCLEISADEEPATLKNRIRTLVEAALIRKALYVITQDEGRKTLAEQVYRLDSDRVLCVPNSYTGLAEERTRYFRERFSIPDDQAVVLYAGGIERWAIDEHLVKCAAGWDRNLVLVLHGWSRDGCLQEMRAAIEEVNREGTRVHLSLDYLSTEDYMRAVSSADIGLAWYRRTSNMNVRHVGLSSGKLAAFLRCGVPVIVPSYLPGLKSIFADHRAGMSADSEYEIAQCANAILKNRSAYSENAREFYRGHLDFAPKFQPVIDRMKPVLDARRRRRTPKTSAPSMESPVPRSEERYQEFHHTAS